MKILRKFSRPALVMSLFLCGIILFVGGHVYAEEWTDSQMEVWKVIETAWESFKLGKTDETLSVDGSLEWWSRKMVPLGGEILIRAYNRWLAYDKPVSIELNPLKIQIYENVANVFYEWKWKGKTMGDRGRQMDTLVKQGNEWKFFGSMMCSCEEIVNCP